MPGSVLLDSNLFVLLVVGSASKGYIRSHKRLSEHSEDTFDLLLIILKDFENLLVTPHIVAETSNLSRKFKGPGLDHITAALGALLSNATELQVNSFNASQRQEYIRLGITDAAVIEVQDDEIILLTDDLDLYTASQTAGRKALNFTHYRDDYGV